MVIKKKLNLPLQRLERLFLMPYYFILNFDNNILIDRLT